MAKYPDYFGTYSVEYLTDDGWIASGPPDLTAVEAHSRKQLLTQMGFEARVVPTRGEKAHNVNNTTNEEITE